GGYSSSPARESQSYGNGRNAEISKSVEKPGRCATYTLAKAAPGGWQRWPRRRSPRKRSGGRAAERSPRLETFPAVDRAPLRWAEGNGGFLAALRAGRLGFRSLLTVALAHAL